MHQITHQFHLFLGDISLALTFLVVLWSAAQSLFFLFLGLHPDCSRAHPLLNFLNIGERNLETLRVKHTFSLPSHLPNSWRKHSWLEIIFPQDFESIALLSLALSVSVEKSNSDSNLNLNSLSMHVVPSSFWKLFLHSVLKYHDFRDLVWLFFIHLVEHAVATPNLQTHTLFLFLPIKQMWNLYPHMCLVWS